MNDRASIGIIQLAYRLPAHRMSVQALEAEGRLTSPATLLLDWGFEHCYVQHDVASFDDLIIESGRQLVETQGFPLQEVEHLFLYGGLSHLATASEPTHAPLHLFRYPVAKLHHLLHLHQANAFAVSQQGCSGLLATIDVAARLLRSSTKTHAICLAGDALPEGSQREIMYNLMSDAAAGLVLQKGSTKNRIVHFYQQTQSYYWDTPLHEQELLAAYFPLAQRVIIGCLEQAGLDVGDVDWFVPHNVSLRSWQILAKLLRVSPDKIWMDNIKRVGHTVSCDHIINLVDMERAGVLRPGGYLVLFTFGFGATWSCLILQH